MMPALAASTPPPELLLELDPEPLLELDPVDPPPSVGAVGLIGEVGVEVEGLGVGMSLVGIGVGKAPVGIGVGLGVASVMSPALAEETTLRITLQLPMKSNF